MWKKSSKGDLSPCFARYDIHVFIGKSHKLLFHNFPFTQSYAITIKWDFERDSPNNAYIHKAWGDLNPINDINDINDYLTGWKKGIRKANRSCKKSTNQSPPLFLCLQLQMILFTVPLGESSHENGQSQRAESGVEFFVRSSNPGDDNGD